eukprot:445843-Prymnesium_polylepis.1
MVDEAELCLGCAVLLDEALVPGYKSASNGSGGVPKPATSQIHEGDRVKALPGIECQGVDQRVVGKEGT